MKSEELMYGNKDYQKFRLTFLFKREKLIYILFALPERGGTEIRYVSRTLSSDLNPTVAFFFFCVIFIVDLHGIATRTLSVSVYFFEFNTKKTAWCGGWTMLKMNHFYCSEIEMLWTSLNIWLYAWYCGSKNNNVNHPQYRGTSLWCYLQHRNDAFPTLQRNTIFLPKIHHSAIVK